MSDTPTPILAGTQGWNYSAWQGTFFPEGTRAADYLSMYARAFTTVEVDSTFYAIPSSSTVKGWGARTPDNFIFALKLPQAITHEGRLRDRAGLTEQFVERARELEHKLGPILIQLGPDFGAEEFGTLESFLPRLPRDLKFAVEFRQRAWITEQTLSLLKEHRMSLALVEGPWFPARWPLKLAERPTADFFYIRWMGPNRDLTDHSHIQVDRSQDLDSWADAIRANRERVGTIYAFMSNYFAGHAPESARDIQHRLGLPVVAPELLGEQISFF